MRVQSAAERSAPAIRLLLDNSGDDQFLGPGKRQNQRRNTEIRTSVATADASTANEASSSSSPTIFRGTNGAVSDASVSTRQFIVLSVSTSDACAYAPPVGDALRSATGFSTSAPVETSQSNMFFKL